jgi:hypothetical protein
MHGMIQKVGLRDSWRTRMGIFPKQEFDRAPLGDFGLSSINFCSSSLLPRLVSEVGDDKPDDTVLEFSREGRPLGFDRLLLLEVSDCKPVYLRYLEDS